MKAEQQAVEFVKQMPEFQAAMKKIADDERQKQRDERIKLIDEIANFEIERAKVEQKAEAQRVKLDAAQEIYTSERGKYGALVARVNAEGEKIKAANYKLMHLYGEGDILRTASRLESCIHGIRVQISVYQNETSGYKRLLEVGRGINPEQRKKINAQKELEKKERFLIELHERARRLCMARISPEELIAQARALLLEAGFNEHEL